MDVAAAFPSVTRNCLLRRMREVNIDKDPVGWALRSLSKRSVSMVISGQGRSP